MGEAYGEIRPLPNHRKPDDSHGVADMVVDVVVDRPGQPARVVKSATPCSMRCWASVLNYLELEGSILSDWSGIAKDSG